MGSASREAVDRKARLAGNGPVLATNSRRSRREAQHCGRPLHGSPEGSVPDDPIPRCSAWKGRAIPCTLRLVLGHPGSSEPTKPNLMAY